MKDTIETILQVKCNMTVTEPVERASALLNNISYSIPIKNFMKIQPIV